MTRLWRQFRHGWRTQWMRAEADRAIDDEAQHYLAELAAENEKKGMAPEEARRAARVEMGSLLAIREQVRESGWESGAGNLWSDFQVAVRRLRRRPGFAVAAVLTLALGLGAATAIFSVIDAVLLRPLPYSEPERLVALVHTAPGIQLNRLRMAPSLYFTYLEEGRVFEDVAIWNGGRSTVTGFGEAEEVHTIFTTPEFLRVLRVSPALGRGFTAADGEPRSGRTVMLTDGYWKERFGGDPAALGRRILINGNAHEVIGVLPRGFSFLNERVSLIVPWQLDRQRVKLIQFSEDGIARLKPGVTLEQANADIARCLPLAEAKFPLNPGFAKHAFRDARIQPVLRLLKDELVGDAGGTLWVVMGAVGFLLAIACANVANLTLVRADGRQRELAVRAALGASRVRIARELLMESLVLGLAGGAAGLGLCYAALRVLPGLDLTALPRWEGAGIDPRVLAFASVLSVGSALLFGLLPAWRYTRPLPALHTALGGGSRWTSEGRERRRAGSLLVVVQVALAMVLLVSSGLMIRTFLALRTVDPGFTKPEQVQIVRVSIPESQVKEPARVFAMQEAILRRFEATPGVTAVAMTTSAPMEGMSHNPVYAAGRAYAEGELPPVRRMRNVSPGYVASIGGRMLAGREFAWEEMHRPAPVVMVSERMAREQWGSPEIALGQRLRASLEQEWRQVIGVVSDVREEGLRQDGAATVYWPAVAKREDGSLDVSRHIDYLIRSPRAGSMAFVHELRDALAAVNRDVPLANVRTLEKIYQQSLGRTRFVLVLLAVAGSMALVLGVVGIYGVVAYSVARRRRDIGIRIALGAPVAGVVGMFAREGLLLSVTGASLGLVAAVGVTRVMESLLYGVGPLDGATYALVFAGLVGAAVVASWLPARRAAAVDPVETLRAD